MPKRLFSTPSADNFFACPDFTPHLKNWLVWPERTDNWRLGAKPIQKLFVELANKLVHYCPEITVLVSTNQFHNARQQLNPKIKVIEMSYNDCFIKDYGPLFLVNQDTKKIRGLKSRFNAWGGEKYGVYYPWNYDDMVPYKLFEIENIDYYEIPIYLNWGMIALDGNHICFASEQGILSDIHNPNLTKVQAEYYLKEYLNVATVIWIPFGLPHDQTKGRLDNIMTLIDKETILLSWTDVTIDERYQAVNAAYHALKGIRNIDNKLYKIIKINLPEINNRTLEELAMIDFSFNHNPITLNQPIVGSYTNLYINQDIVVLPIFESATKEQAIIEKLKQIFATKHIIFLNVRELILGKSGIHSIICQQTNIPS